MVLDTYLETFTTEFSELKAYIEELLRSNSGGTMRVKCVGMT